MAPRLQRRALPLLAVERARRVRASASVAVSGVVAALSLAVALTVMVASFRGSVTQWLDQVLPADLYVRTASSGAAQDTAYFDPAFVQAAATLPGVARVGTQRSQSLLLQPTLPARHADGALASRICPWWATPCPCPPGRSACL